MYQDPKSIQIDSFDYHLPESSIALFPLPRRDTSKLLVYKNNQITDAIFSSICSYLPASTALVFNTSKVIQARLLFKRLSGATIEIFCLEPTTDIYSLSNPCTWKCLVGNVKKWKEPTISIETPNGLILHATFVKKTSNHCLVTFSWNLKIGFLDILEQFGEIPLPPYLNRKTVDYDKERYQTVYSNAEGSVAAPTAGLHFTPEVLSEIEKKGIQKIDVILHVGAGTFKPVKTKTIAEHDMHHEQFIVSKEALIHLKSNIDHLTVVGTTSLRTIESLYWMADRIHKGDDPEISQWDPYERKSTITPIEAIDILIEYVDNSSLGYLKNSTGIIIVPGYSFKFVKALITNFHQPKSTLLLLVEAFIGKNWKQIYQHALDNSYRFLSFGDSSLLIRG